MKLNNAASLSIVIITIVITLIYGQALIIPFIFALLIWFMVREFKQAIDKIEWVRTKIPSWIKSVLASVILLLLLGAIGRLLTYNIQNLAKLYPTYEPNIQSITDAINNTFKIDLVEIITKNSGDFDFGAVLSSLFNSISGILGNAFLIIIYAIFIFLEESNFDSKLGAMFSTKEKYASTVDMLNKIERSISRYIGLKTLVSLITGVLSYVVLVLVGIDAPIFWAFLIFLLNFIPTVGSLIATLFPAGFALLQFGEFTPFFAVLGFVGAVQLIVGNIIEPRLMGNSLNISSLVAILSLSFWGSIWGVTGMLISVPITVIIIIIFSHFPGTRPIAIMLSDKGNV